MTEINGNLNLGAIPQQPAQPSAEKETAPAAAEVKETVKDVPVGQSAIAGKSQIKADNIAKDLATFCGNPNTVALSDKFFDKAYAALTAENDPNAYEKACLLTSQFVAECVK